MKIAVLGFGVVGGGVVDVIYNNAAECARSTGETVEVKYILDLFDFPDSPYADKIVHDFAVIENDAEVGLVVETMGGKGAAYDFTKRALLAGKHVVTSNKELVAEHGTELLAIAAEKGVNYLFEASTGGGIPIIRPLAKDLCANRIKEIYGILNGTTNYILTQMFTCGTSFEAALKNAQELGYAERNPAADIEGHDACRKICILASVASGFQVPVSFVPTEGITAVTSEDVACANEAGCSIKLLGRAVFDDQGKVTCCVGPHFIPRDNLISSVDDVFNAVVVEGNAVGRTMFYGRGAGAAPTASAVVADVLDCVRHRDGSIKINWTAPVEEKIGDASLLNGKMFVRLAKADARALADAAAEFGEIRTLSGAFITPARPRCEFDRKLAAFSEKYGIASTMRVL